MIVYKDLFSRRNEFSGSTAIVYSTLISYSLWDDGEMTFNSNGFFDIDKVEEMLDYAVEEYGDDYINLPYYSCKTISQSMNMSLRNAQYAVKYLHEFGYIINGVRNEELIKAPRQMLRNGYIKIEQAKGLKGWQLIFYSFLKDRANPYGGCIDTWATRLAELFHTTKENVHSLIRELKAKGYVERTYDGKLRVLTKNGVASAAPLRQNKKPFLKDYLRVQR